MSVKKNIDCFDKIKVADLSDKFKKLIKEGMSLQEQRDIGTKLALEYHQELFNDLEGFKSKLGIKSKEKYASPDKSATVKEITDRYSQELAKEQAAPAKTTASDGGGGVVGDVKNIEDRPVWNNTGTKFNNVSNEGGDFIGKDGKKYKVSINEDGIEVYDENGKKAGWAVLSKYDNGDNKIIGVSSKVKRAGIATAMYDFVDSQIGKVRQSGHPTEEGSAFWDANKPKAGSVGVGGEKNKTLNNEKEGNNIGEVREGERDIPTLGTKVNVDRTSDEAIKKEKEISQVVDKMTDSDIKDKIDDIGYSITGRNLFYKKAQEIYHREVMSWEEMDALPKDQKPNAQKEFDKWTEENKRKILKEALTEQSLKETTKATVSDTKALPVGDAAKPTTKAKEIADKVVVPPKSGDKLRDIAKKIREKGYREALPNWAKTDLPEGTEKMGFGGKALDNVIATAIELVADALDAGKEFTDAVGIGFEKLKDYYSKNTKSFNEQKVRSEFEDGVKQMMGIDDKGKDPPADPPKQKQTSGGGKMEDKGILNRLYDAKNTPKAAKEGYEREGLQYETKSQEEAAGVAKAVVETEGIDEAVKLAAAGTFDGDVNSLIFAESLNQLYEQEAAATDPKVKFDIAKKFAKISISYDMAARNQGRFNSAVNFFYKKSPLGMMLKANADQKDQFEKIAKGKDESWEEFFERMKDEPGIKDFVDKKVQNELKKERVDSRKKRIDKVRAIFKAAKEKIRKEGGATYGTIIPPHIMETVIEAIELAYEAGEAIATIVHDAVEKISKEIGTTNWDKQKFIDEWKEKLGGQDGKMSSLDRYKERLKKQIDDLDKQIAEKKRKSTKKNKAELDDDAKELVEKRDAKKEELERVAPLSKDNEFMMKQLDKFRDKLKGLTESQKDEVIRNSYLHIIQNGGLEQADFRKIIAAAMGYGDLTDTQARKMKEMVDNLNAVEDASKKWRTEKTAKSELEFHNAQMRAAKAAKDLADMFDRKAGIPRLINSIMQGDTLTLTNLFILNPLFNVVNQLAIRFPVSLVNGIIDGVAKAINPKYEKKYSSVLGQRSFFGGLSKGFKEGASQVRTGLNRMDYIQKEIYPDQIRPLKSIKELGEYRKGERQLSKTQVAQRVMQIFPGTFAEFSFRMLNLFDKPQRFAAGAATASAYAKMLGIPSSTMDYKIFMEFPREIAYDEYQKKFYKEMYEDAIAKGLPESEAKKRASEKSAEKAGVKADEVRDAILQEGARSTFQQDNWLVNSLNWAKKPVSEQLGGGVVDLAQSTLISPYIKIPSNAFWSYYNLAHPLVALLQATWHTGRAIKSKNKGEYVESAKQAREARYWMGHAVVGVAWTGVAVGLTNLGIIIPGNDGEEPKKEREGEFTYEKQGMINITKLLVFISGGDPKKVKEGTTIPLKWLGSIGMLLNTVARNNEEMTPEQKENRNMWMANAFAIYDVDDLREIQNGIFGNTSALINALGSGSRGAERFGLNIIGMYTNILQPASFAQIIRATNPYYSAKRADSFGQQLAKDMADRSWIFRKLSGVKPSTKISIWGEPMKKPDDWMYRFLGWDRVTKNNFAQVIYEDAKKYNDIGFFPPAVSKKLDGVELNAAQQEELEILIGTRRGALAEPYANDAAPIPILDKKYSELSPEIRKKVLEWAYSLGREFGISDFYQNHKDMKPKGKSIQDIINDAMFQSSKTLMNINAGVLGTDVDDLDFEDE